MIKQIIIFSVLSTLTILLSACDNRPHALKIGIIAGPEEQLVTTAAQVAAKRYHLAIQIIEFSDYTQPNAALNDGSIDANIFQHLPYLEADIFAHQYKLTPLAKTFIFPMAIYSQKFHQLSEVTNGTQVAIPNDPSNEARALLLLQQAGLITMKPHVTITATINDIANNPKQLQISELDAALLPRMLDEVGLAVINTNFAVPAGLNPSASLFHEDKNSAYVNLIVVRTADKDKLQLHEFAQAFQSPEVIIEAKKLFGQAAIPAW